MTNPFKKRATEYIRDDESFLAAITPAPISTYLSKYGDDLYDRLVVFSGAPGSGKTTLALLFQYRTVTTLLRHSDLTSHRETAAALAECGIIKDARPAIMSCRIGLASEYRDFWEFPYPEDVRTGLLESMLQARTCLAWVQNLRDAGHENNDIEIIARADAQAASHSIGVENIDALYEKARAVELAVYGISAALIPPRIDQLSAEAIKPYRPFDVIEKMVVATPDGPLHLKPLVIFDDAHNLHRDQFTRLQSWLVRRDLKVARWVMTRLDALSPEQVLQGTQSRATEDLQRVQTKRDITEIRFQSTKNRAKTRKAFQKIAKDMSTRYLRLMPMFERRGISTLSSILLTEPPRLSSGRISELRQRIASERKRLGISENQLCEIKHLVTVYVQGSQDSDLGEDVQFAMQRVLMHRLAKRLPTSDLFNHNADVEPSKPLKANSAIAHAAQIHLMHLFDRPYYYGMDTLCDSGSDNAELFLQIAERLVSQVETKIVRNQAVALSPREQHRMLRERGGEIVDSWTFPESDDARRLIGGIAARCVERTVEPNASLGAGANAYGILEPEFSAIHVNNPRLARILQFGVAYNAINLVREHRTKKKIWCLIELGGAAILHYGLPFFRGGFIEGDVTDLTRMLANREL